MLKRFFKIDAMNKILALLIISIAFVGISTVSASFDADNFNMVASIAGASNVDGPFNIHIADSPFNVPFKIPVDDGFLRPVFGADDVSDSFNIHIADGSFSVPIAAGADLGGLFNIPLNIPVADGPFSVPIAIVTSVLNGPF